MKHHPLVPLTTPVALALAMCAPANAADTRVAELQRPSTIRSYAGIQVFSAFDGSADRLSIRRGGAIEQLPVAPSQVPFDVDIGPDRNGRPQLIYTRCQTERTEDYGYTAFGTNGYQGCDLVTYSLAGRGERRVQGANTAAGNEFAPTLWKGRIAFARQTPGLTGRSCTPGCSVHRGRDLRSGYRASKSARRPAASSSSTSSAAVSPRGRSTPVTPRCASSTSRTAACVGWRARASAREGSSSRASALRTAIWGGPPAGSSAAAP
jgi:hypothetical protein